MGRRAAAVMVIAVAVWGVAKSDSLAGRARSSAVAHLRRHVTEHASGDSPTFYRDVEPILQGHCHSCHRAGEIAPTSLVTYEEARGQAGAMAAAVRGRL